MLFTFRRWEGLSSTRDWRALLFVPVSVCTCVEKFGQRTSVAVQSQHILAQCLAFFQQKMYHSIIARTLSLGHWWYCQVQFVSMSGKHSGRQWTEVTSDLEFLWNRFVNAKWIVPLCNSNFISSFTCWTVSKSVLVLFRVTGKQIYKNLFVLISHIEKINV
jgi:hypothetical protein